MAFVLLTSLTVALSFLIIKFNGMKGFKTFLIILVCFLLCYFAGSRTKFNDTESYIADFLKTPTTINDIFIDEFSIGNVYLFQLWKFVIFNYISQNVHIYFFLSSLIFVVPCVFLIFRYSKSPVFSIFLFVWCGMYIFSLAGLKQSLAIGVLALALVALYKRKFILYFLLNLIAIGFHAYSIVFLILPFLGLEVFNKRTVLFIILFLIFTLTLSNNVEFVTFVTKLIGKDVSEETALDGSVNIFRALVFIIPLILMVIGRKKLSSLSNHNKIFVKTTLLCGLFMFLALFGNPILFGRIPQYFMIGFVITMPLLIRIAFGKSYYKSVVFVATICFALYGLYSCINNKVFISNRFGLELWWF